ncbi:hypothetical protein ABGB12_29875 [Actinocorallia sp. B10E7]|uniref:hypothetical protein n=1 Tax=Actinocorallia sp. B10E7 TaxID=3153558 RepID=UPI00325F4206
MVKAGVRLRSQVGGTEVIVVRAPAEEITVSCCGVPMAGGTEPVSEAPAALTGEPVLLGKRYSDAAGRIELLCLKPGDGPLTVDGEVLSVQAAKLLPASD